MKIMSRRSCTFPDKCIPARSSPFVTGRRFSGIVFCFLKTIYELCLAFLRKDINTCERSGYSATFDRRFGGSVWPVFLTSPTPGAEGTWEPCTEKVFLFCLTSTPVLSPGALLPIPASAPSLSCPLRDILGSTPFPVHRGPGVRDARLDRCV